MLPLASFGRVLLKSNSMASFCCSSHLYKTVPQHAYHLVKRWLSVLFISLYAFLSSFYGWHLSTVYFLLWYPGAHRAPSPSGHVIGKSCSGYHFPLVSSCPHADHWWETCLVPGEEWGPNEEGQKNRAQKWKKWCGPGALCQRESGEKSQCEL